MFKHTFNLFTKSQRQILLLITFIFVSIFVFLPSIYGLPFWDDWVFIFRSERFFQQPFWVYFLGGKDSRSWPLFYTVMNLFLKIYGEHYFLYHLSSVILHGINGFLLWKILNRLKINFSFWLTVLYLVHPLQLFTVGWIIQFKTILSLFFFLLTVICLLDFYILKKYKYFIFALFLFSFSLLSKSSTVGFVIIIPFFYSRFKQRFGLKKIFLYSSPFLAIAAFAIVRTLWSFTLKDLIPQLMFKIEPLSTSLSSIPYYQYTAIDRIQLSLKVFAHYLGFIFWPASNPIFQKKIIITFSAFEFVSILVAVVFMTYLVVDIFRSGKLHLKSSLAFFLISIIPFCGFIWIPIFNYSNFVPYWLSVPVLGLLPLLSHYINKRKGIIALAIVYGLVTHIQAYDLRSNDKIFLSSIAHSPEERTYYVALAEQYLYSEKCLKAEKIVDALVKLSNSPEEALREKVKRCKQVNNRFLTSP